MSPKPKFNELVQNRSVESIEEHGSLFPDELAQILMDEHGISTIATNEGKKPMDTNYLNDILSASDKLAKNDLGEWYLTQSHIENNE